MFAGVVCAALLLLGSSPAINGDFVKLSVNARGKAKAFLQSKIDPDTQTFPEGERAAGILGLIALQPTGVGETSDNQVKRQLEVQSLGVDFLQMINHIMKKLPGEPPLKHVDDSTLLKYLAALRGRCLNGNDYYGHNLMAEVFSRIDGDTSLYGGMMLALCNAGEKYSEAQIMKLAQIKTCPTCQFRNEEVAMNLLAAVCIVSRKNDMGDLSKDSVDTVIIPKLVNDLARGQLPDGSFGRSFLGTALALQVLNRVPIKYPPGLDLDKAVEWLTGIQRPDGSFGSSIEYTSLALPAFTGQTPADLRQIKCSKYMTDKATVAYILEDNVVSHQTTRSHFLAPIDSRFFAELSYIALNNKATFSLGLTRTPLGVRLLYINGLYNDEKAAWKMYRIERDGDEVEIKDMFAEKIRGDSVYKLSYVLTAA